MRFLGARVPLEQNLTESLREIKHHTSNTILPAVLDVHHIM